eukprot:gene13069-15371_t
MAGKKATKTTPVTFEVTNSVDLTETLKAPVAAAKPAKKAAAASPAPASPVVAAPVVAAPAPVVAAPVVAAPAATKKSKAKKETEVFAPMTEEEIAADERRKRAQALRAAKVAAATPVVSKLKANNSYTNYLSLDDDGPVENDLHNAPDKTPIVKKKKAAPVAKKVVKPVATPKQIAEIKQAKAREEEKLLEQAKNQKNTPVAAPKNKNNASAVSNKKAAPQNGWLVELMESLIKPGVPATLYKVIFIALVAILVITMTTLNAANFDAKYMALLGFLVCGLAGSLALFIREYSGMKSKGASPKAVTNKKVMKKTK